MLRGNNSRVIILVISSILLPIIITNICSSIIQFIFEELITYSNYQQKGCERNPRPECLDLVLQDLESRDLYTLALSSALILVTQAPLTYYLFAKRAKDLIKALFLATGFSSLPYLAEYFATQRFQIFYLIWLANFIALSIGLYFTQKRSLNK